MESKELYDTSKEKVLTNIGHQLTTDVNFRKFIWVKFVKGIKEFKMINKGDRIAVCISGGKDSMLLAKCIEELQKTKNIR